MSPPNKVLTRNTGQQKDSTQLLEEWLSATKIAFSARFVAVRLFDEATAPHDDGALELKAQQWVQEWSRRWQGGSEAPPLVSFLAPSGRYYIGAAIPGANGNQGYMVLAPSGPLSPAQEQALALAVRGLGAALENLRLRREARKRQQHLELLYKAGREMGSVLEVRELLERIMQNAQHALGALASSVLLVDPERGELYFEVARGKAGRVVQQIRLRMDQGIAGWIASHGKPLIVNDVSQDNRFYSSVDKSTGFVTKAILGVPIKKSGRVIGVIEVLNKADGSDFTLQDQALLSALAADAAAALENARLHQAVLEGYMDTIRALAGAVDAKDPYTRGHSERVMNYVLLAAEALELPPQELEVVRYGGVLHDVGKIGIDDRILRKSGQLIPEEEAIMRTHPMVGARIIEGIAFLEKAKGLVLHHHERYDGSGYPHGVAGEDIPLGARLIAVADAFDALTTDRPYRSALPKEKALERILSAVGTHLCPTAVEAFIQGLETQAEPPLTESPSATPAQGR